MKLSRRDVFLLLGLSGIVSGVCLEYGPSWGAIVAGTLLFLFGWLGGDN